MSAARIADSRERGGIVRHGQHVRARWVLCHKQNTNCNEAINYLMKAIEIDPNNQKALFNIGICYTSLGNYSESIAFFDKAIALDSTNGQYYCNRGYSKLLLNNSTEACKDFNIALDYGADKAKDLLLYCKE